MNETHTPAPAANAAADGNEAGAKRFQMTIALRLPLMMVGAALALAIGVGIANYLSASSELRQAAGEKLSALAEARASALQSYLGSIEQDLRSQSQNPWVRQAIGEFGDAWRDLGSDQTETLQRLYIADNPHPTGQKEELDRADDSSSYSAVHGRYHPWFRTFLRERGYYDVFLFDPDGNLIYSVFKELDYATNLNRGQWKATDLGNAFRAARDGAPGTQAFFDFKPYAPSNDAPASFISAPVHDDSGTLQGVLVFQMPIARMNQIMQQTAGMGESGETFIVGADYLMRSDSRFSTESTILKKEVKTPTVVAALDGETGVQETPDYRGVPVMSAYKPFEFAGTRWALLADADTAEVLAPVYGMRNQMLLITGVLLLATAAAGLLLTRGISRMISQITATMRALAGGDLSVDVVGVERGDEIGDMARAVRVFKNNAVRSRQLEAEAAEADERAQADKKRAMTELADSLETAVGGVLSTVDSTSTELQSNAKAMSSTAEQTSQQAAAVAAASEEASTNVQAVASAAEEMSSSIDEIRRQVSQSTEIAAQAVGEARNTNGTVQGLAEAAQKIGEVVNLISAIAEQTNLLALNATIEAARAGEAGKGFAVVASEVKNLANQTATATEEIAAQVGSMQTVTEQAVTGIEGIGGTIEKINDMTTAIAAAVEQQGAATQEIARNVQEASSGTSEVSSNISGVSDAASATGASAKEVLGATEKLNGEARNLKTEVERFLQQIRAA